MITISTVWFAQVLCTVCKRHEEGSRFVTKASRYRRPRNDPEMNNRLNRNVPLSTEWFDGLQIDGRKSLKQIKHKGHLHRVGYKKCHNYLQLLPSRVEHISPPFNLSRLVICYSDPDIMQVLNLSHKGLCPLLPAPLDSCQSHLGLSWLETTRN